MAEQKELLDAVSKMCEGLGLKQEVNFAGVIDTEIGRFMIDYKQKWVELNVDYKKNPELYQKIVDFLAESGYTINNSLHH